MPTTSASAASAGRAASSRRRKVQSSTPHRVAGLPQGGGHVGDAERGEAEARAVDAAAKERVDQQDGGHGEPRRRCATPYAVRGRAAGGVSE